jgi:hypothetical protein
VRVGIAARGLRRSVFFNPDPYVKLRIRPGSCEEEDSGVSMLLPHHGQESRTLVREATTHPSWESQVSHLQLPFFGFSMFLIGEKMLGLLVIFNLDNLNFPKFILSYFY